jgi:hypothetical protein
VIDQLAGPQFAPLWKEEVGAGQKDATLTPIIFEAINAIREAYRPFAPPAESRQASDTLVTRSSWDLWLSSCLRHLLHRDYRGAIILAVRVGASAGVIAGVNYYGACA